MSELSNRADDHDDEFAELNSDYAPPREGARPGPPDDWTGSSWFDFRNRDWWYRFDDGWRRDPPPIKMLGYIDGDYFFVTNGREVRRFTSDRLYKLAGLGDLFGGDLRWPTRHYPVRDRDGDPTDRPKVALVAEVLIRECHEAGFYDGNAPFRGVGVWRGPDGQPVVHAGGRIFHDGQIFKPGDALGSARYVIGSDQEAPSHMITASGGYEWQSAGVDVGHTVLAHLDRWNWPEEEARDLFAGGLWCDMLGDAPLWKPHKFVRAPAGSGKTTLLKYMRALLGGAAHNIQRTYSKAQLEQKFSHTARAFLLEEAEGEPGAEAERLGRVLDLVLLLSDEGAVGGRFKREIDLHGTATMIATLTDSWRTTVKSRLTLLELHPLRDRIDRELASPEALAAMTAWASNVSASLRARAIARFDLFQENLKLARVKILALGGSPRDADQLGHLIAGWACMTGDEPMSEDEVARLERFMPYILTLAAAEDGADDPNDLLNTLLGLPAEGKWRSGKQFTIGQMIARAREPDGDDYRESLPRYGLRLEKLPAESWPQAWLAVANKHPGLDLLFSDYPQYRGGKRGQILSDLRCTIDGVVHKAKASETSLRFAGAKSRAWFVPPQFLPSLADEHPGSRATDMPGDPA